MNSKEALETLCSQCKNHEMCMGTGCEPKKTLASLIEEKLTRRDLDNYLSNIDYEYHDGYEPKGFPIEFGCKEYWQAVDSILDDVLGRIVSRYGLDEERPNIYKEK